MTLVPLIRLVRPVAGVRHLTTAMTVVQDVLILFQFAVLSWAWPPQFRLTTCKIFTDSFERSHAMRNFCISLQYSFPILQFIKEIKA